MDKSAAKEESGFFEPYSEFAKILRIWLIAYGIGVPALLIGTEKCWEKIAASGQLRTLGFLFLGGVAMQVFMALFYKMLMWQLYIAEIYPQRKSSWHYKCADTISNWYLPEFLLDVGSIGLFSWATLKALLLLT